MPMGDTVRDQESLNFAQWKALERGTAWESGLSSKCVSQSLGFVPFDEETESDFRCFWLLRVSALCS